MISHRHKFIFVHIPKTGGMSIESVLRDDSCELLSKQHFPQIRHTPLNHLTLQEMLAYGLVDVDMAQTYFKFCIVRNPWDRAVSEVAYNPRRFAGQSPTQKLRSLLRRGDFDNHVRPQVDFIDTSYGIAPDFIGRFENLEADFEAICAHIGVPRRALPYKNSSQHKPYWTYYDEALLDRMAEKYQADIQRFGYTFR